MTLCPQAQQLLGGPMESGMHTPVSLPKQALAQDIGQLEAYRAVCAQSTQRWLAALTLPESRKTAHRLEAGSSEKSGFPQGASLMEKSPGACWVSQSLRNTHFLMIFESLYFFGFVFRFG